MTRGLLLAFIAYAVYAFGDALIKLAGGTTPVFVMTFVVILASALPVAFSRPADERWRDAWRLNAPLLTPLRALAGIGAGICGFHSFSKLPLAEAYTLIFLMPFFITVLSMVFLGEKVRWRRWTALAVGMAGVLLVIRPGFRELNFAHLAAVAAGFCGAVSMVILRQIGNRERRTSLLGSSILLGLLVNGALMMPGFTPPSPRDLGLLATAGVLHGSASLLMLFASQAVPANRIAPTQYSQLIWGVALGMALFSERPDAMGVVGLLLVAVSGLATFIREDARGVWPKEFRDARNRF